MLRIKPTLVAYLHKENMITYKQILDITNGNLYRESLVLWFRKGTVYLHSNYVAVIQPGAAEDPYDGGQDHRQPLQYTTKKLLWKQLPGTTLLTTSAKDKYFEYQWDGTPLMTQPSTFIVEKVVKKILISRLTQNVKTSASESYKLSRVYGSSSDVAWFFTAQVRNFEVDWSMS